MKAVAAQHLMTRLWPLLNVNTIAADFTKMLLVGVTGHVPTSNLAVGPLDLPVVWLGSLDAEISYQAKFVSQCDLDIAGAQTDLQCASDIYLPPSVADAVRPSRPHSPYNLSWLVNVSARLLYARGVVPPTESVERL